MKREICKVFNWSAVGGRRRLLYRLRSQRVSAASAGETVGCMLQLQPRPLRLINLPTRKYRQNFLKQYTTAYLKDLINYRPLKAIERKKTECVFCCGDKCSLNA